MADAGASARETPHPPRPPAARKRPRPPLPRSVADADYVPSPQPSEHSTSEAGLASGDEQIVSEGRQPVLGGTARSRISARAARRLPDDEFMGLIAQIRTGRLRTLRDSAAAAPAASAPAPTASASSRARREPLQLAGPGAEDADDEAGEGEAGAGAAGGEEEEEEAAEATREELEEELRQSVMASMAEMGLGDGAAPAGPAAAAAAAAAPPPPVAGQQGAVPPNALAELFAQSIDAGVRRDSFVPGEDELFAVNTEDEADEGEAEGEAEPSEARDEDEPRPRAGGGGARRPWSPIVPERAPAGGGGGDGDGDGAGSGPRAGWCYLCNVDPSPDNLARDAFEKMCKLYTEMDVLTLCRRVEEVYNEQLRPWTRRAWTRSTIFRHMMYHRPDPEFVSTMHYRWLTRHLMYVLRAGKDLVDHPEQFRFALQLMRESRAALLSSSKRRRVR